MRYYLILISLGMMLALSACDDPEETQPDASVIADAGRPNNDAGLADSGQPVPDSGVAGSLPRPGLERPPAGGLPAELRPPR
jgi:hypothetical protein